MVGECPGCGCRNSALGIPDDIAAHSFRGAVAITADVPMHVDPAMTQRRYMARGRAHQAAADALDRTLSVERADLRRQPISWDFCESRPGVRIMGAGNRLYREVWSRLGESNPRP